MASNTDERKRKKLMEAIDELMEKPFGRLVIDKHQDTFYVELTDKTKI